MRSWSVTCPFSRDKIHGSGTGEFVCPDCGEEITSTTQRAQHARPEVISVLEKQYKEDQKNVTKKDVARAIRDGGKAAKHEDSRIEWLALMGRRAHLMWELLKDWKKGNYKAPWRTIAAIVAALIYVINPWDIIPDYIPVLGLIDDAFIVALCAAAIKSDLRRYCKFRGLNHKEYGL